MATQDNSIKGNVFQRFNTWLTAFLRSLSERLELFSDVALPNLYTLFLLLIVYLFYWTFPQAKDLLLTINQEGHLQIFLFFASLITMAGVCWYMPRFFHEENKIKVKASKSWREVLNLELEDSHSQQNYPGYSDKSTQRTNCYKTHFKDMIPRILASTLLFVVALGILNVGNEINRGENAQFPWSISAYSILGVTAAFISIILLFESGEEPLFYSINKRLGSYFEKRTNVKQIYLFFLLISLGLLGLMWTKRGAMDDLRFLLAAAILLSFAFFAFTVVRKNMAISTVSKDYYLRRTLVIAAGSLSLLFILINFVPTIAQRMNPLVCANLAFVFYISLLYFLRLLGHRKGILAVVFLFTLIFITAGVTNSHRSHEVSYVPNTFNPADRLSLKGYFKEWLDLRQDSVRAYLSTHPGQSYPVLVVSAEGGGSRAAYWTSLVHGYLENHSNGKYYRNHLFALTGASGGSTGNSTFLAMEKGEVLPGEMDGMARKMFQENYLSSSLTLLLGADLLKDIFGIRVGHDRAKQLEKEWSRKLGSNLHQKLNAFETPFLELWYGGAEVERKRDPLLFINTTQVQGGRHAIFSPVILTDTAYWGMDLLDTIYQVDSSRTIPLVTANLLNASFPYINPAGHIKGVGSFVDAGYFDNYGARTGVAILHELKELKHSATDTLFRHLKFISVLIRNSTADLPLQDTIPHAVLLSNQLVAPVMALGSIRSAINDHNLWTLKFAADTSYLIDLRKQPTVIVEGKDPITPIIPLARYLSPIAIKAMDASLDTLRTSFPPSSLMRLLHEIGGNN